MMRNENSDNVNPYRRRQGIVLLVTLVLLVLLSALAYTLSSRLAAQRHRMRYVIDYQSARYGCDSAVKYALATVENISAHLISRPNEPDFSDLFRMDEQQYQEILAEWAAQKALERQQNPYGQDSTGLLGDAEFFGDANDIDRTGEIYDINRTDDLNDINDLNDDVADLNEPNSLYIPGPYGPPWPLVTRSQQFKIGSATVTIEVEDENAKYPVSWVLLDNKEVEREATAGFETFCEWMDVNYVDIESLKEELKQIKEMKPFQLKFKPMTKKTPARIGPARRGRTTKGANPITRPAAKTTTISVEQQFAKQAADVSKLLHSSMIDTETLAWPTIISETRKESALKYMGMWGSARVNINTAPRQVLEAAFMFGGDADKIAEEIIQRRRMKPFKDIDELKQALFGYSDSIRKCEDYITTSSNFFTVRITAVSGAAEASAVIAITKQGNKINRIGVISG
ncbi:MAG TPA: type II secretion system protein GspK [Sedimentisphaerales bacterium]|nr:type II secretion system protein GspK [Sedimentisphaerales bacterium]